MNETSLYVCMADTGDGVKHYVTLLPPDVVLSRGLVAEAIVGVLLRPPAEGEGITPDVFARNSVFVNFLHDLIARHGPGQPDCRAEASRIGNGLVVIVDRRTKTPEGPVPLRDIVGAFDAKDGAVVTGSYRANPNHAILSEDGFFQLPDGLYEPLLRELEARSA